MIIFEANDPLVLSGEFDREGFTPAERRALDRRRRESAGYPNSTLDIFDVSRCWTCGRVQPCGFDHPEKGPTPMFAANTAAQLTDVTFTTEEVDEETRRVVVCTFALSPFKPDQAAALNVSSLIFEAKTAFPKAAIKTAILAINVPLQRLTMAMAPDTDGSVVLESAQVVDQIRVKVKRDRDPAEVAATLKVTFRYPTPADLFSIVNGVTDTWYLTFEPEQRELGLTTEEETAKETPRHRRRNGAPIAAGDELRPGTHAQH